MNGLEEINAARGKMDPRKSRMIVQQTNLSYSAQRPADMFLSGVTEYVATTSLAISAPESKPRLSFYSWADSLGRKKPFQREK